MATVAMATVGNRKTRRGKKAAMLGAAAATATAMAVGLSVPDASAANVDLNAVTTGPLFRIAQAAGFNSVSFDNLAPPLINTLTIHLNFTFGADPVNL